MRETRAAARAQLIRASNLEDLSDANYRQNVPIRVSGHSQDATAIRGQILLTPSRYPAK